MYSTNIHLTPPLCMLCTWAGCLQNSFNSGMVSIDCYIVTIQICMEMTNGPDNSQSSNSVMPYRFSVVERDLLAYATGCKRLSPCICDKIAPRPLMEASVSNVKAQEKLGYARTGELTSAVLSSWNACSHSDDH